MIADDQEAILRKILDALHRHQIPYFVTGSVAGAFHGAIRETHDADIAFDASYAFLPRILEEEFGSTMYVDVPDEGMRQFNVIDTSSAYKIDFWPIGASPFEHAQLSRRVSGHTFGRAVWFASVEDLILSKLRWYAMSSSALQLRDLELLIALHRNDLDHTYLIHWSSELGLTEHFSRLWNSS